MTDFGDRALAPPDRADLDAEASGRGDGDGKTRCGFVAIIGAPNAGKSTLLNTLVGQKISIVSPKVQTTRTRILGIVSRPGAQIVLIDTPGIFQPRRRLDRAMVDAAWGGAADADEVVLLVDAARAELPEVEAILDQLAGSGRPTILALNKVDLVSDKGRLLASAARLNGRRAFTDTFMISAKSGDGCDDLVDALARRVPEGPFLYPEDQAADIPMRLLAAEVTREKVFLQLQQELPYQATVETEAWEEFDDGSVRIDQVIFVRREGQRAIILGHRGARVKAIGMAARAELEELMECRVHLKLFVKVREGWEDDPERYRPWGLRFEA